MILFVGLMFVLSSCSNSTYKVKVTHDDKSIDTLITSSKPYLGRRHRLESECGCETYSHNVESFSIIKEIKPIEKPTNNSGLYMIISFILLCGLLILFYIKTTNMLIKKVLTYIVYVILVILVIKLGVIVIQYLPKYIETLIK
jgi:hypothetical protein